MKLSSRKELLIEADNELKFIRESLYDKKSLNESTNLSSLLKNAFTQGIISTLVKYKNISKLPMSFWSDATFLLGNDILKSGRLKVDSKKLEEISSLIDNILIDFKSNPLLNVLIKQLNNIQIDMERERNRIITNKQSKKNKSSVFLYSGYKSTLWKEYLDKFDDIVENQLAPLIESILNQEKYKTFSELLQSTFSGLTDKEISNIKMKYIYIIKKRSSDYLKKNITYRLTYPEFLGMPKSDYPPGEMYPRPMSSSDA